MNGNFGSKRTCLQMKRMFEQDIVFSLNFGKNSPNNVLGFYKDQE